MAGHHCLGVRADPRRGGGALPFQARFAVLLVLVRRTGSLDFHHRDRCCTAVCDPVANVLVTACDHTMTPSLLCYCRVAVREGVYRSRRTRECLLDSKKDHQQAARMPRRSRRSTDGLNFVSCLLTGATTKGCLTCAQRMSSGSRRQPPDPTHLAADAFSLIDPVMQRPRRSLCSAHEQVRDFLDGKAAKVTQAVPVKQGLLATPARKPNLSAEEVRSHACGHLVLAGSEAVWLALLR